MKWLSIVLAILGVALVCFFVSQHPGVFAAVVSVGVGGLFAIIGVHLLQVVASGHAWWLVQSTSTPVNRWPCYWLRLIREGINNLLPITQVGGEVVAVRLLVKRGVAVELAGAAILFDLALEVSSQIFFAILALGLLYQFFAVPTELRSLAIMVIAAGLALSIGVFTLSRTLPSRLMVRLRHILCPWAGKIGLHLETLYNALAITGRHGKNLAGGFLFHLASWLGGTLEVYLILNLIGVPASLLESLIIESLGSHNQPTVNAVRFLS